MPFAQPQFCGKSRNSMLIDIAIANGANGTADYIGS
ncbi:hypothetical protein BKA12_001049 [Neomicrococcus lactis]|uniref:Uncharacterized protein n=1 Tax=Neomicrococcus lactis TaxID=732241 RepID=A0A7W8YAJ3_9MICC|nr:hypothetical protein [Neomicrococcus lactis]